VLVSAYLHTHVLIYVTLKSDRPVSLWLWLSQVIKNVAYLM